MAETFCIGLYTPNGPRRLELPESADVWTAIDRYDRRHGTNLYDLYEPSTIEFDSRVARGFPPYDPSDEEYTLTGENIADLLWPLTRPSEHWIFDRCAVAETRYGFAVLMQGEDGGIVRQDVASGDMEEDRRALDEGYAPIDGWEDGVGNSIAPYNGEEVESAAEVAHCLRKNMLDNWSAPSRSKPKASNSRKSGTSTKRSTKTATKSGTRKAAPKSSKNARSKPKAKSPAKRTTKATSGRR